jgi:Holliday junction resolvase RusA-like endonuclease
MKAIHFTIQGNPIAKARPRFARRGNFVSAYSPQGTEEGLWILSAREHLKGQKVSGPISMSIYFYLKRPKSHYNKKGLKPGAPEHPIGKPDLSNMVKFAEDCLNECFFWDDDSLIVETIACKRYAVGLPYTNIVISELIF